MEVTNVGWCSMALKEKYCMDGQSWGSSVMTIICGKAPRVGKKIKKIMMLVNTKLHS